MAQRLVPDLTGTKSRTRRLYREQMSFLSFRPWAVAFSLLCCQCFFSNILSKLLNSEPPGAFPGLGVSGVKTPALCRSVQTHGDLHREGHEDSNAFEKIPPASLADVNIPKVVQSRKMCHSLKHRCFVLLTTGGSLEGWGRASGISVRWFYLPSVSRISVSAKFEQHIHRVSYSLHFHSLKSLWKWGLFPLSTRV